MFAGVLEGAILKGQRQKPGKDAHVWTHRSEQSVSRQEHSCQEKHSTGQGNSSCRSPQPSRGSDRAQAQARGSQAAELQATSASLLVAALLDVCPASDRDGC